MESVATWLAPAATMIAAMMTAANLGSRLTGYGFVVFTVGSICWVIIGLATDQQNLVLSNGFLTVVNLVGIWRWLGRQVRHEEGSRVAADRSARARVPTLFSAAAMVGAPLLADNEEKVGTVIDAMLTCKDQELAYLVISEGGVGGVGETLHVVSPADLSFAHGKVRSRLTMAQITALPEVPADRWPEAVPVAAS